MKKYLLSLLVVWLSFIWFSNWYTFECNFNNSIGTCTPTTITYDSINNSTNTINWNPNAEYTFYYKNIDDSSYTIKFECTNNICTNTSNFDYDDLLEYDFNFMQAICVEPWNDWVASNDFCNQKWWWNEWWNTWWNTWWNEWWNEWWDSELIWQLSPVITWLENSINEFIPYVVYVWLGVLGVIIWFVAIKRLINRTRSKSLWVFSSRRRRK